MVDSVRDTRTLDRELKESLRMAAKFPVMERVNETFRRFEAYIRRNQLEEIVRPKDVWRQSFGRTAAQSMLQGIAPYSFRETVRTRLKWNCSDENNPDVVRQMIYEVAAHLEAEFAARALDDELDGRRQGGGEEKTEKK